VFDDDEKGDEELDSTPEEIEDLDAPDEEGEDVKGGMAPKIISKGCTCNMDCLTL
jgi:hypothetical protein